MALKLSLVALCEYIDYISPANYLCHAKNNTPPLIFLLGKEVELVPKHHVVHIYLAVQRQILKTNQIQNQILGFKS